MDEIQHAEALRDELVRDRRYFHETAEVGLDVPLARAYILKRLGELGVEAQVCGAGVRAELGHGGPVLLLRADFDALPMPEESGLPFQSRTPGHCHACGHDLHAAMLLGAARLLKAREAALPGTVRLMFQPGEECFLGARSMIDAGILAEPRPEAALACHVAAGRAAPGAVFCQKSGTMMLSVDEFSVLLRGRGAHGAYPEHAVDPITMGVALHQALQGLRGRESGAYAAGVLTVGQFTAGSAPNILPDTALLRGTLRTGDEKTRLRLKRRLRETAAGVAAVYGGTAEVEFTSSAPALLCDPALTGELTGYAAELGLTVRDGVRSGASEDFAAVAAEVPATFLYLTAGFPDARGDVPAHNPKVQFNEDVLPLGAALLSYCARRWLEKRA